MSKQHIVKRLVQYGKELYNAAGSYTSNRAADRFVRSNSNAWLFGVIFDQGIPYERAWEAPYVLKQRLRHLNMRRIAKMPLGQLRKAVKGSAPGKALHRYVKKVPLWLKRAAAKLVKDYGGDALNIWRDCRTAGEVIERLDEFPGISQKKAHMAARILHEEKVNFSRWGEINVAVDVHIRRVWKRAGLVRDLSVAGIMRAATELKPDYPGELDYPTWIIETEWCHSRGADCHGKQHDDGHSCPLLRACPKNGVRT
jgi:uncharacterized HhH-GPD family protein